MAASLQMRCFVVALLTVFPSALAGKTTTIELFGSTLTRSSNGLMVADARTARCTESLPVRNVLGFTNARSGALRVGTCFGLLATTEKNSCLKDDDSYSPIFRG